MNALLLGHVFVFVASALVCVACLPRARAIRHAGTRHGLLGLLVSVSLWSGGYAGYLLAPTVRAQYAFYILGFVFAFVAVGSFLYFCAAYTGRPPRQAPYRRVVVAAFLVFIALKATNPLHNLYFTTVWTTEPFPHLAIQHQLLYWVLLGVSYALVAVGFFMLIERFYHTGTDSRPLVVLAGMTGIPAAATILASQTNWLLPLMYEPPGVALFAVGTLFVYIKRFEAIRLTGESNDPAIFLDADSRVRDYNHAARELVPALQDSIGTLIEDVSRPIADSLAESGVVTLREDGEMRYYQISRTPITSGEVMTSQLVTITDVTDRESYRRRLEEKTEQLETMNRIVQHDIRNDMAVVHGWASTLRTHVDEEGLDALEQVLQKSQNVIEITDTVRDFVDSLSGDHTVNLKPVSVRQHLDSELSAVRESYPDARIRVSGEIPETDVTANELLSSVFRNVLENAVRHSDEATPEIDVSCAVAPDTVRIRIADNGPGIPDEQKDRVFGRGEKGAESQGTGLGLYLVATLVKQFDGRVWVEDNDPKGAVFVLELVTAA